MSTTKELKEYLINEGDGFLLNTNNNGKTIMLSGTWGAGKTHFWQENILKGDKSTKGLFEQLEDKACVYISLYGKDNLDSLKKEVLIKASLDRETVNEIISKEVSTFGVEALSSIKDSDLNIFKLVNAGIDLAQGMKSKKGIEKLKDGGIICFDDFERKSKEIDLNDLFGFISQLAIEYQCKVIIILNSDVFEGEEASVFKTVKEKTVNKYFHFEPTSKELFELIFETKDSDEIMKYELLKPFYNEILGAIEEAEELNARIYIQVLDNCLEWIGKGYDDKVLRTLVLSTINFILNNITLDLPSVIKVSDGTMGGTDIIYYKNMDEYPHSLLRAFGNNHDVLDEEFIYRMLHDMLDNEKIIGLREEEYRIWIKENKKDIKALWKYGYRLNYAEHIDKYLYVSISNFIKTGILLKQTKEVVTSVPPKAMAEEKV